jgi:COP9 signalosome complex subunit 7
MDITSDLTEGSNLQPFLLLAKKSKGKAIVAIIQQTLNASNIYVFGELLEIPNVLQLQETEDKKILDLLKIFAYGTWNDYKLGNFDPLTPIQTKKLKQLTIVTLSSENKVIPYSLLQEKLDIKEVRELEDLIIDAIYQGIIQGKLDQRKKQLEIEFTMGRDLRPETIDQMIDILTKWSNQSDKLLESIQEKINHANFEAESDKQHKIEFEKNIEKIKNNLKAAMDVDMPGMHSEFMDESEGKRRPKIPSKLFSRKNYKFYKYD